jgi:hypothetical protein
MGRLEFELRGLPSEMALHREDRPYSKRDVILRSMPEIDWGTVVEIPQSSIPLLPNTRAPRRLVGVLLTFGTPRLGLTISTK